MDKETTLFLELWEKENWDYVFFVQGIPELNQRAIARIVFDATRKLQNSTEDEKKAPANKTNYVYCSECGNRASNYIGEETIVRAFVLQCPECVIKSNLRGELVFPRRNRAGKRGNLLPTLRE